MDENNRMLPKDMLLLQILSLSLILPNVNSQEWTPMDDFFVFKVGDYNIYFNKGNTTEFFSCICNNHITCTQTAHFTDQFEVYNTIFDNATSKDTSGPYQCSVYSTFRSDGIFVCTKEAASAISNTSVTQLKPNGCLNSFTNVTCDSNNASLTWAECNYSVMCVANGTALLNETHTHPERNGGIPTKCTNISNLSTISRTSTESTTGYNKQSSPASNSTNLFEPNSDTKLTLIISITVSLGVLIIIVITASVLFLFRRRKQQSKMKIDSFQHRNDACNVKNTDHYDTCTESEAPKIIEPYSIVTLNEYTATEGLSNLRKCIVVFDGNTNLNNDTAPTAYSETKIGCGSSVTEFSEMTKRDDNAKWKHDHGNHLQEVGNLTLSEMYSKAETLPNVISDKEHIYFELEPESITKNHQEDSIHQ
ncbi:unnamed protein product [Lymnaea stagnalis]|uniref:Uncharacterized protein n=1 Tax=Lymnaea stagnalis TaxID=6523 RepID=A0AAV2HIN9_LYMST